MQKVCDQAHVKTILKLILLPDDHQHLLCQYLVPNVGTYTVELGFKIMGFPPLFYSLSELHIEFSA